MDLALEMRTTVGALSRAMTEREFREWQLYAATKMLPARRVEMYLAQISLVVAKSMGGAKNTKLEDFLLEMDEEDEDIDDDAVPDAADLAEFFGATVVRKKG